MKTIREFLEEQINEQLIQAVLSQSRIKEGVSKVKIRPVEQKETSIIRLLPWRGRRFCIKIISVTRSLLI